MIMQSISAVVYIILIACLLPYVFTVVAKVIGGFKGQDNLNPREFLSQTTGLAARADAVQKNSFESLPLFIAAILMAEYMVVNQYFIYKLGSMYIVLRIIYGICYLANWGKLRSVVWLLSMACPILLLILVIRLN